MQKRNEYLGMQINNYTFLFAFSNFLKTCLFLLFFSIKLYIHTIKTKKKTKKKQLKIQWTQHLSKSLVKSKCYTNIYFIYFKIYLLANRSEI